MKVNKMVGVIVCPVCGFSFRDLSVKSKKDKIVCPMCGHEFSNPNILPFPVKEDDKKFW